MEGRIHFDLATLLLSIIVVSLVSLSCDHNISPIAPKAIEYSIYGPLNIGADTNHIRVHDTNEVLSPESTQNQDITVILTNLDTGANELLVDSVVQYGNIFSHNYRIQMPIEYDTRYKLFWEDEKGFEGSLITQTTKQSEMTVSTDTIGCYDPFYIELDNIDLEAGERLDAEVAIHVGGRWYWTFVRQYSDYNAETNTLVLGWSAFGISYIIFAGPGTPPPDCKDFSSKVVKFRFNHIGYMLDREPPEEGNIDSLSGVYKEQQLVLSRYGEGTDFVLADSVFLNEDD